MCVYVYICLYKHIHIWEIPGPGSQAGTPLLPRACPPRRPSGAPWNSESAQGRSKTSQDRCQTAQGASRTPREGRRTVPKRPKVASRRAFETP